MGWRRTALMSSSRGAASNSKMQKTTALVALLSAFCILHSAFASPPNHLAKENSPYLRQHANNPVDWYPWGKAALAKAKKEEKPIFLSIGYSSCHWCHVMEAESFSKNDVAAVLNRDFVSIKVDR